LTNPFLIPIIMLLLGKCVLLYRLLGGKNVFDSLREFIKQFVKFIKVLKVKRIYGLIFSKALF